MGKSKVKPMKKKKADIITEGLLLAKDWAGRAKQVMALAEDETVITQEQAKAVRATSRTYEKCALELVEIFKDKKPGDNINDL